MSGNFLSCIEDVKDPFEAQRGGRISLDLLQKKRASSHVEGRISWFFLSCGSKRGVPLDLRRGPQGLASFASAKSILHASCEEPLRISLQSLLGLRSSSGAEARPQGYSPVLTCISG